MASNLPTSMRASHWTSNAGGIEHNLRMNNEAPLPKNANPLPTDHTLIKVAYTSLNPFDYKVAEAPIIGQYVLAKPSIPCSDFSGTVVETKLTHLKPGDRVFGRTDPPAFGTLAEYVVVGKYGVSPVPDGVLLRDAASAGIAALAAYQCLFPYVQAGSEVFINGGSGGTGTFGIQFAKASGCWVTTTCSEANVDLCRNLGADDVLDYKKTDIIEHLKSQGKQYDLIVDNVFSDRDLYWQCHHYLKPAGQFVTLGDTKPGALKDIALAQILPSWLSGGQRKFLFVRCVSNLEDREQIGKWMQEGKVKPVIEQEFEMEEAGKAFQKLKTGRTRGKIVVRVAGE